MRKFLFFAVLVLLTALTASADSTTVVTFDDLTGQGLVANSYGGINWNDNWTYYNFAQPPYTPASGTSRVYDLPGKGDSFNFSTPTLFDGAFFSGETTTSVEFKLYNGATLVWTSASIFTSATPVFLSSGYSGLVTEVDVTSNAPDFFVMDNVTYGGTGTSTVPEPSSLMFLGMGLFGLVGTKLRRK